MPDSEIMEINLGEDLAVEKVYGGTGAIYNLQKWKYSDDELDLNFNI